MVVEAQWKGHKITGLRLDASDVQRYFPKHVSMVELHIGHLCIGCQLPPGFWRGAPVIGDPRLCEWLEARQFGYLHPDSDLQWALIPEGRGKFKVESACRTVQSKDRAISLFIWRQAA
jgi:hypothetical protein